MEWFLLSSWDTNLWNPNPNPRGPVVAHGMAFNLNISQAENTLLGRRRAGQGVTVSRTGKRKHLWDTNRQGWQRLWRPGGQRLACGSVRGFGAQEPIFQWVVMRPAVRRLQLSCVGTESLALSAQLVSSFTRTAITGYQRLGGFNNRYVLPHGTCVFPDRMLLTATCIESKKQAETHLNQERVPLPPAMSLQHPLLVKINIRLTAKEKCFQGPAPLSQSR